ncbi:GbsR/MarR family transcriptional regulator [Pontibacter harenae]|uniref:GbsR/MarR family transcriptional regulator n=1 Tax=Pontibacter harenae TaxID=2894083 RepID=UPI001E444A39|nr:MarR family transcriptional regulator [Pontibacter harenae]MCC9166975.1 MarR family transcriptional regulator [Pontibacter harenae]
MNLTDQQRTLIEQIGVWHENNGIQPAAARVMGLMIVSDKRELTFDEITEALSISKSATSNALNLLLRTEHLEYITFPGDRKRYFKMKISNWREAFTRKIDDLTGFNVLLRQVLEVRNRNCDESDEGLQDFISFLDYLHQELPNLLAKWEEQNKKS